MPTGLNTPVRVRDAQAGESNLRGCARFRGVALRYYAAFYAVLPKMFRRYLVRPEMASCWVTARSTVFVFFGTRQRA